MKYSDAVAIIIRLIASNSPLGVVMDEWGDIMGV